MVHAETSARGGHELPAEDCRAQLSRILNSADFDARRPTPGRESIGLNIVLPHEQAPNPYVTPYLSFQFHYFALRKMHFLMRARAVAVFPGGFGTFDEMFELLTLIQTGKMKPIPVLLFGKEFWTRVIDFGALAREGVISPADLELITWCETAEDAWEHIATFYEIEPQHARSSLATTRVVAHRAVAGAEAGRGEQRRADELAGRARSPARAAAPGRAAWRSRSTACSRCRGCGGCRCAASARRCRSSPGRTSTSSTSAPSASPPLAR